MPLLACPPETLLSPPLSPPSPDLRLLSEPRAASSRSGRWPSHHVYNREPRAILVDRLRFNREPRTVLLQTGSVQFAVDARGCVRRTIPLGRLSFDFVSLHDRKPRRGDIASSTIISLSDLELADTITACERARSCFALRSTIRLSGPIARPIRAWAKKDLNFRPHAYQACALTS